MDTQLKFFEAKPEDRNVQWLERVLDEDRNWLTAQTLAQRSGGVLSDRQVRMLAGASPRVLSGPGSPGYRHIRHATPEEVHHWTSALLAQGKAMIKRGTSIRRCAHGMIGG